MQIAIVGFGYIGSVIGAVLAGNGHHVFAIDSNQSTVKNLNNGICFIPEPSLKKMIGRSVEAGLLSASSSYEAVHDCDVILVTVGTSLSKQFDPDLSAIADVFNNLSKYVKDGQIVMIKSTVTPGITRKMTETYLDGHNIFVGFSPERLAEGNAIGEFQTLPIIVGGINELSTSKCAEFWSKTLDVEIIKVSSSEAAELIKLANNQWIDTNIALANEMAMLCDSLPYDLDVLEIIEGANSLKKGQHYVNFLTPSIGVGGYCLTKDPWFLSDLGYKNGRVLKLPSVGRDVNDYMPFYCVEKILNHLKNTNQAIDSVKIAILGYSFKNNSGDMRFSPMTKFVKSLIQKGFIQIQIFDRTITDQEVKGVNVIKCATWQECVREADYVVFGTSHEDIESISIPELITFIKHSGVIFDGRRYFSKTEVMDLKKSGLQYIGIGRSFQSIITKNERES